MTLFNQTSFLALLLLGIASRTAGLPISVGVDVRTRGQDAVASNYPAQTHSDKWHLEARNVYGHGDLCRRGGPKKAVPPKKATAPSPNTLKKVNVANNFVTKKKPGAARMAAKVKNAASKKAAAENAKKALAKSAAAHKESPKKVAQTAKGTKAICRRVDENCNKGNSLEKTPSNSGTQASSPQPAPQSNSNAQSSSPQPNPNPSSPKAPQQGESSRSGAQLGGGGTQIKGGRREKLKPLKTGTSSSSSSGSESDSNDSNGSPSSGSPSKMPSPASLTSSLEAQLDNLNEDDTVIGQPANTGQVPVSAKGKGSIINIPPPPPPPST